MVWLDNPAVETPQVLAMRGNFYSTSRFPKSELSDGVAPMMIYNVDPCGLYHAISQLEEKGEFQDLTEREQPMDGARSVQAAVKG